MTISELLHSEVLRRQEFPVASKKIYLAHAGVCPLPRRVAEAVTAFSQSCTLDDQETVFESIMPVRQLAAQLLRARAEEIAFVGPTSIGLSYVAQGLEFRKGDNVLIYFEDYPSNVYPWMTLAEQGVEVRLMNIKEYGRIRAMDVLGQVDERTRLVALASCHFITGYRVDIEAIGRFLRSRNILFCIDGIQTLGAFPMDAQYFDFLAADAHKWMLGPCGCGLLYVRKEVQERLRPSAFGWHNVRCPNYVAQETIVHPPDARRYEAGTANLLGLAGLRAALELLLEFGVENIAEELLRKRVLMVSALQGKGYQVLQGDATAQHSSAIVSFHRPGTDAGELHARLAGNGIIASLRTNRAGQRFIRLSPHFYNSDEELSRVFDLL